MTHITWGKPAVSRHNSFFLCAVMQIGPPLWSSGLSSWLQIPRSGFDSRRYQVFREVVGLERNPHNLVGTIEKVLASV
jgi:hypothetical protein